MDTAHHIQNLRNLTNITPTDLGEKVHIMGCGAKGFIVLHLSNDHFENLSVDDAEELAEDILTQCQKLRSTRNQPKVEKRQSIGIAINNPRF